MNAPVSSGISFNLFPVRLSHQSFHSNGAAKVMLFLFHATFLKNILIFFFHAKCCPDFPLFKGKFPYRITR
jgi:hypothetical protein